MIPASTKEVARIVEFLVRRADAGLADGAARNAAASIAARRATRLEEARTLRELRLIEEAFSARERAARRPRNSAHG